MDERRALLMPYGLAARQKAIAEFSARDAERLPAYDAALERAASRAAQARARDAAQCRRRPHGADQGRLHLAPDPEAPDRGSAPRRRPVHEKRLGFPRRQWFENETVKAAFAFDGIVGSYAAPSTPGTAYVLLHHCFGEVNGKPGVWGHALGGMGAITQAMAKAATEHGVEIRTDAEVKEVVVRERRGARRACSPPARSFPPAPLRRQFRRSSCSSA